MKIKVFRPTAELCGWCNQPCMQDNVRFGWGRCCNDFMQEKINMWYLNKRKVESLNERSESDDASF